MTSRQKIRLVGLPLVMIIFMSGHDAAAKETAGELVYVQNCMVCHGDDGSGAMPGVPEMTKKDPWLMEPEKQLLSKLKQGIQTPGAPVSMPPKGGNPELSDDELLAAISYLRTIVPK